MLHLPIRTRARFAAASTAFTLCFYLDDGTQPLDIASPIACMLSFHLFSRRLVDQPPTCRRVLPLSGSARPVPNRPSHVHRVVLSPSDHRPSSQLATQYCLLATRFHYRSIREARCERRAGTAVTLHSATSSSVSSRPLEITERRGIVAEAGHAQQARE